MTASVNGVFYHHNNHHRITIPAYHHHQHHHPNMRAYDLSNDSTPVSGGVTGGVTIGAIRMPDSPEAGLKNQSNNASSSASSSSVAVTSLSVGPPLSIHNNNHHKINSLSGLNGSHSPHSSTSSVGCGTPSLATPPPVSATSSGHVTSGNSTSGSSSSVAVTNNGSSLSAPALVNPEQLGNSVRQLSKLKRFLATLQQFGGDISPEVGERVHGLILGLVSSNLSIEEFHMKIQEVTNYPMRPFVIPLLKSHLPLLQAEVGHFARMAKQTPQQYVRQHEQALLDLNQHIHHSNNGTTNFSASAVNSTSDLPSSATDRRDSFDTFADSKDIGPSLKRRSVSDSRSKENGYSENSSDGHPPPKRHQGMTSPNGVMPGGSAGGGNSRIPPGGNHIPPVGFNFRFDDNSFYRERERYERYDRFERTLHRDFTDDREMEDEWKNIHTMLSCILGMVEKTKRALAILQHRSQSERQEMAFWNSAIGRRHLLTTPPSQLDGVDRAPDFDAKKRDLIAHYKTAEDRVSEVRRRAVFLTSPEEAVNEVKRQAVAELQKAVSAAETKASELVATERAKMERLLGEARRQAAEEALATINQQDETTESCWNCGRKANETCSGCNVARYCGAFCQHKDWENHHRVCGQGTAALQVGSSTPAPGIAAPTTGPAGAVPGTNSINNGGTADSQGRLSPQSPSSVKRSPSPITISSREKITEKH